MKGGYRLILLMQDFPAPATAIVVFVIFTPTLGAKNHTLLRNCLPQGLRFDQIDFDFSLCGTFGVNRNGFLFDIRKPLLVECLGILRNPSLQISYTGILELIFKVFAIFFT